MKRTVLAVLISCLFSSATFAQGRAIDNDQEILTFGFMFQYISSDFKIYKNTNWRDPYIDDLTGNTVTDSLNSISSTRKPGFGLGFLANLKMNENTSLRFNPGLAFTDRLMQYEFGTTITEKTVQATMVDLPLSFILKSDLRNNFRVYMLGGAKYSKSILSKKKLDDSGFAPLDKLLKNKDSFISYEAGIGIDIYFEYFKMTPELKYSHSMRDVLQKDANAYSNPLDKLFLHSIQFSLLFQ